MSISFTTSQAVKEALHQAEADLRAATVCTVPFSVTRLRSQLLGLVRQYFAAETVFDPATSPEGVPSMCLKFDAANPKDSPLKVENAFSAEPPSLNDPAVFVRIPSVKFTKLAIADYSGTSLRTHHTFFEKSFTGAAVFYGQHAQADAAVSLMERLQTHLESTKHLWMQDLNLLAFDVDDFSDAQIVKQEPDPVYRAQLAASFTGRVTFQLTEASLPLKRVSVNTELRVAS